MLEWRQWSGAICLCVLCTGLIYETKHLQHTPTRPVEMAVVIRNNFDHWLARPQHSEQPFMPGPPTELWRTIGATSGAVGTVYQVMQSAG